MVVWKSTMCIACNGYMKGLQRKKAILLFTSLQKKVYNEIKQSCFSQVYKIWPSPPPKVFRLYEDICETNDFISA